MSSNSGCLEDDVTWTCCEPKPHSHRHCLPSCSLSSSSPPLQFHPRGSHCLGDSETRDCQRGLGSPGIAGTASSCHRPPRKSAPRPHPHWPAETGGRWMGGFQSFEAERFLWEKLCIRCLKRGAGLPGSRGLTQSPFAPVCFHLGWFSVKRVLV